jgi:hypothetical protein
MDLHPRRGETDAAYGNSGYLTGWTARGFPNLYGFAWYRLRIHITNAPGSLWLKMPDHVDDAYQVFANGRYVGELGAFNRSAIECYRSRPLAFEIPAPDKHGDMLLAIRFYMERSCSWAAPPRIAEACTRRRLSGCTPRSNPCARRRSPAAY